MEITEDHSMMNMRFIRKLPVPKEVKELYPLSEKGAAAKAARDAEIAKVFKGESDKFLLVIGPCSADREESVLDYVHRLARVQEQVKDKIIIIPRIYTGKPRTTGAGYKGMMHQPDPDGVPDMYAGILAVRSIHSKAIEETGLSAADEMLYPANYRYLSDLLSYVAVGARSVENQDHRLAASGMDVPCGMKTARAAIIPLCSMPLRRRKAATPLFIAAGRLKRREMSLPMQFFAAVWISTALRTRIIITRI